MNESDQLHSLAAVLQLKKSAIPTGEEVGGSYARSHCRGE